MRALSMLITAAAFTLLAPAPLGAQPADATDAKEFAKALTKQGTESYKAGEYDEAIDLFQQADVFYHAPTIVFREAQAHEKKGDLLTARDRYRDVVNEPLGSNPPKAFQKAQSDAKKAMLAVIARIPTVRITLHGATQGAQLSIDGKVVPPGTPLEQNPGAHTITVSGPVAKSVNKKIRLAEKDRIDIELELPAATPPAAEPPLAPPLPAPVASAPPAPVEPPPAASPPPIAPGPRTEPLAPTSNAKSGGMPTSAVVSFITGGVGLVVGIATVAIWSSRDSSIENQCELEFGTDDKYRCPPSLADYIDSTKLIGKIFVGGFILAGVGTGVGFTLLATDSTPAATTLSAGPGSVTLRGTF